MQILRFDRETAKALTMLGSQNVAFTPVKKEISYARVVVMYIDPGGRIGYHQAIGDQLFMVAQGSGWVTGEDRLHVNIDAGQAAIWQDGEWHESGSDVGEKV